MKNVQEDLKNLDSLIEYIENDLIGEHKEMKYIDEGIKRYAEAYHEMKMREEIKENKPDTIPDFMEITERLDNMRVEIERLKEFTGLDHL